VDVAEVHGAVADGAARERGHVHVHRAWGRVVVSWV
jgi:hypothetical protein